MIYYDMSFFEESRMCEGCERIINIYDWTQHVDNCTLRHMMKQLESKAHRKRKYQGLATVVYNSQESKQV